MNRRLQFNLRFLLLGSAIAAVGFAILANRGHAKREAIRTVERLGGICVFDYQTIDEGYFGPEIHVIERDDVWLPGWLRRLVGEEHFSDVVIVSLHDSPVVDADLKSLRALKKLQVLDVENTSVTEAGLIEFRQRSPPVQILR